MMRIHSPMHESTNSRIARNAMHCRAVALIGILLAVEVGAWLQQPQSSPGTSPQAPAASPPKTNLGSDPNGNPLRLAVKTGHVSNYDESKVRAFTLPGPLVAANGARVRDERAWRTRRAEILRLYETEIYGRIPARTPRVTWTVGETDAAARDGAAIRK